MYRDAMGYVSVNYDGHWVLWIIAILGPIVLIGVIRWFWNDVGGGLWDRVAESIERWCSKHGR